MNLSRQITLAKALHEETGHQILTLVLEESKRKKDLGEAEDNNIPELSVPTLSVRRNPGNRRWGTWGKCRQRKR
jgi:hypothetical protein